MKICRNVVSCSCSNSITPGVFDDLRGLGRQNAWRAWRLTVRDGIVAAISGQPFPVQRLCGGNERVGRIITTEGRQRERVVLIGRHRDEPRRAGGLAPQHHPERWSVAPERGERNRSPCIRTYASTRAARRTSRCRQQRAVPSLLTESGVSLPPPPCPRGDQVRTSAPSTATR